MATPMQYKPAIPAFLLCFVFHSIVDAQSVLYSSTVSNDINTRFEVIGKAGNFYWLYKIKKNFKIGTPVLLGEQCSFEVYDNRLNRVTEIESSLPDVVVKQYMVPQKVGLDQLVFKKSSNKTTAVVNRFAPDGAGAPRNAILFEYPAVMDLEDIIVSRSPDRSKILLLCFVRTGNLTPDMYAKVYNRDWELLHDSIYKQDNLVQPLIQYYRTEYLMESPDATPVKITNTGDWLMVTPSRRGSNYVLCHFKKEDSSFIQLDVPQSRTANIEYCSLSAGEGKHAYVGILENISPADRRLRMIQYNMAQKHMDYDTSYSFQQPNGFKHLEYLYQEELIQIPGKGFMYMKEYGRQYFVDSWGEQIMLDNEQEYAAYSNHASKLKFNDNEYTRNSNLSDTKRKFERGDLSVKYFPFHAADSSWGGLIHVQQVTELRYDNLSYACVPDKDRIIFLYNSLAKNDYKVSSSTVVDHSGQALDEGVIFWQSANVLNFQNAKLVQEGELFVPFNRNVVKGFAIIRF